MKSFGLFASCFISLMYSQQGQVHVELILLLLLLVLLSFLLFLCSSIELCNLHINVHVNYEYTLSFSTNSYRQLGTMIRTVTDCKLTETKTNDSSNWIRNPNDAHQCRFHRFTWWKPQYFDYIITWLYRKLSPVSSLIPWGLDSITTITERNHLVGDISPCHSLINFRRPLEVSIKSILKHLKSALWIWKKNPGREWGATRTTN